jgi:histidine phosphotransferase ChpT
MNEPHPTPTVVDTAEPLNAADLVAHVSAKLCHDFITPSGAVVSGLELMNDPSAQDVREEALKLVESSAKKLVSIVNFARVAYGAATTSERFSSAELQSLAQGVFDHIRADLNWAVSIDTFEKPHARALLNLAQIGGAAVPTGGLATVRAERRMDEILLTVDSTGPRARLKPEVVTGLKGERLQDGLAGQWIQPYWLYEVVRTAGGALEFEAEPEKVSIRVRMPV